MDPQPGWTWPESVQASTSGVDVHGAGPSPAADPPQSTHESDPEPTPNRPRRHYKPRQCRICLESVEPTFEDEGFAAATFLRSKTRVRYVSEDPEYGRLICPCKCKGSQKYVHEGCLKAWRLAGPLSDRNYWKCPTCGFEYRMERLQWGRWISGRVSRVLLTLVVFTTTIFILGFVGDPIINLWLDPVGTIADSVTDQFGDAEPYEEYDDDEPDGWTEHFTKGFLSLGLLGFAKSLLAMGPWYWNIRLGGRRRGGRDRIESVNWMFVIVGIFTFLGAVWKGINFLSGRFLESASERIIDVQPDDEDDEDDVDEPAPAPDGSPETRKDR